MLEEIIKWMLSLIAEFVGYLIATLSPVRLARRLPYGISLSEEPDGFFALLALWFSDIVFALLVIFGIFMLCRRLFS